MSGEGQILTGEVGRVGGDHDEGEEPPHAGHHSRGDRPDSQP